MNMLTGCRVDPGDGLIDELRLIINPVILGNNIPLFQGVGNRPDLKLTKTRAFGNGNVLLYHRGG